MLTSSNMTTIDLTDQQDYQKFLDMTPQHAADYTFTNIWGWSGHYGLEWKIANDLCWIHQTAYPESDKELDIWWAPLGNWETIDWASLPQLKSGFVLHRVPERLCHILQERLGDRVAIVETRGQWEYLYKQSDLANLSGNKLHKKKNHVNAYRKFYGEDYRQLTLVNAHEVLELQHKWCTERGCSNSHSLAAESDVLWHVVQRWEAFPNLVAGGLYIEDKLVAFSIGEPLDSTTMVVHFEKALPDYRGIYQTINCCFAKYTGTSYQILNREQDTDEEGLRQAKESYCPTGFLVKNTVRFL